jgi:5-carboxymethyl-2-hydroxymuconate isomerase
MPHLVLEHSDNIIEKAELSELLGQLHTILAEKLPTEVSSCRSRTIACPVYCVGEGGADKGFVHITLKVFAGRTPEVLQKTCEALLEQAKKYFANSLDALTMEISIELLEVGDYYFKYSNAS